LIYCTNCSHSNIDEEKTCGKCSLSLANCPRDKLTKLIVLNDRYKLISPLKAGGMAGIYVAKDLRLNCLCAVKELFLHLFGDDDKRYSLERFKTEAELLAKLRHPNLPCVTDYFFEKHKYYLVMDYIAGEDFLAILKKDGKPGLKENMIIHLGIIICEVLEYLHSQQPPIIYRDLKPSNIMIRHRDNHIMLVDFGVAKALETKCNQTSIGTQGYSPREQYKGKPETRSDIYSLGATMHHLLTGITPTPFRFKSVREINPDISEKLERVIFKSLQSNPEDRYKTATEMKNDLIVVRGEEKGASIFLERLKSELEISESIRKGEGLYKYKIKVFIVEDDSKLRLAFQKVIEHTRDMELSGLAGTGEEAIEKVKILLEKPDIILMDISMPGMNGIETTREIKKVSPPSKVIILTALSPDRKLVLDAFYAGASGYLIKGVKLTELVESIRKAHIGGSPIEPSVATFLLDQLANKPQQIKHKQSEIDEGIRFNLAEIDFIDLLTELCSKRVRGKIAVHSPVADGDIYLDNGNIIHCSYGENQGTEAFYEIINWTSGKAIFSPDILPCVETISSDTEKLLVKLITRRNQFKKLKKIVTSSEDIFKLELPQNSAIIKLLPEELYILAYLDGTYNINDIAKETNKSNFEISKAIYDLSVSGLVKKVN